MENIIRSLQHDEVKFVKALYRRKERKQHGLYIIEGVRFVEEALRAEAPLAKVYYTAEGIAGERGAALLRDLSAKGVHVQEVSDPVLAKMADTEQPQGVLGTVHLQNMGILQQSQPVSFVIVCDRIQDPGNLGTIIRTADAAGVQAIFTTAGTVDVYNAKVLRATMGSIFHVPILADLAVDEILSQLSKWKVQAVGTSLMAKKWHFQCDFNQSIAFWLGNEAAGIDTETLSKLSEQIKIPMPGRSESLNVAVAASVLMYECVRQRMLD
jgi:TrmH family RNA methyltransferase